MKLFPRAAVALLAAVAVVLVGCGKPDDGTGAAGDRGTDAVATTAAEESDEPAPPRKVDACALLPEAEAEELAGTPLDDPTPVLDTCSYTAPPTGPTAQVEIYVGDGAKKILDVDRELDHEFETLSGIGDEAYLEDGNVFVRKGTTWVAVRLVRLNDPQENRAPLTKAAERVAARL